jgi:hypothetical protein
VWKLVIAGAAVTLAAACSSQSPTPKPTTGGAAKSVEDVEGAFDSSPGSTPPAGQDPSGPAVRVGETQRIGDLELTVSRAKSAGTAKKLFQGVYRAENRFLITPVAMKNVGKKPFSMMKFVTTATLTDSAGATYNINTDVSSTQTVRATPSGFSWDINPSSKGKVVLVFDIPKDVDPVSIAVDGIATIQF